MEIIPLPYIILVIFKKYPKYSSLWLIITVIIEEEREKKRYAKV